MKPKTTILSLFVALTVSTYAHAEFYYRFWQGWKLDSIPYAGFRKALNDNLIPATVKVGAGRGLFSYLPVLPPLPENRPASLRKRLPDEIALVVYDSEANYRSIRNTPEGEAYGVLHWDYFDKNKGSKSTLPEKFKGKLESSHAYDVLESSEHWQKGYAVYVISACKQDASPYINQMKREFVKRGLSSYLVLAEEHYVIEYQLWRNKSSFEAVAGAVDKIRKKFLTPIKGGYGGARKSLPYPSNLNYSEGLNTQFDPLQEQTTIADPYHYAMTESEKIFSVRDCDQETNADGMVRVWCRSEVYEEDGPCMDPSSPSGLDFCYGLEKYESCEFSFEKRGQYFDLFTGPYCETKKAEK